MPRDPRAYLWGILEAAQAIQAFTRTMDVADYKANDLVQAAVERKFVIIGEATDKDRAGPGYPHSGYSTNCRLSQPTVPWLRDSAENHRVEHITRNALPELIVSVRRIENEL